MPGASPRPTGSAVDSGPSRTPAPTGAVDGGALKASPCSARGGGTALAVTEGICPPPSAWYQRQSPQSPAVTAPLAARGALRGPQVRRWTRYRAVGDAGPYKVIAEDSTMPRCGHRGPRWARCRTMPGAYPKGTSAPGPRRCGGRGYTFVGEGLAPPAFPGAVCIGAR